MSTTTKQIWNELEWIDFGNRVKQLRTDLQSLITDGSRVMRATDTKHLWKLLSQIDKAKSDMENAAAKHVSGELVTRIFYGDKLPNPAQLLSKEKQP